MISVFAYQNISNLIYLNLSDQYTHRSLTKKMNLNLAQTISTFKQNLLRFILNPR